MEDKKDFFRDELPKHKATIKKIEVVLAKTRSIFELYEDAGNQWPYEISNEDTIKVWKDKRKKRQDIAEKRGEPSYSFSTNAMMQFALRVVTNNIQSSPLLTNTKFGSLFPKPEDDKDENGKKIYNKIEKIKKDNLDEFLKEVKGLRKENDFTFSGTYGKNDPFTFTWLFELLKLPGSDLTYRKDMVINLEKRIDLYLSNKNIDDNRKKILEIDGKVDHSFPLLRCAHFLLSVLQIENTTERKKILSNLRDCFQEKINQHLSSYDIKNSLFDVGELVFAMEGLIAIDKSFENYIDRNLLERFFKIVKDSQQKSAYWRPIRPFITKETGVALLPLSIEIASSLLRICKLLEENDNENYFDDNVDLFEKYIDWLYTTKDEISVILDKTVSKQYSGWHSEHVHADSKIHPWETAHVILFLMQYKAMYESYLGRISLKEINLTGSIKEDYVDWKDITLARLEDEFNIANKNKRENFSMLLYGPPGTGKSSIAEAISKRLGWEMITITPSNFISDGPSQVEKKAKDIFDALEQQKNIVILFDEIDRMILDRDSRRYLQQSDIFQFMTPSMLVKIKDLRVKKRVIFVVATNYAENIDNAVKRPGRIDKQYLILPPNSNQREIKLLEKIKKESISMDNLKMILYNSALHTFLDIKEMIKRLKLLELKNKILKNELLKAIGLSSIRLTMYNDRFKKVVAEGEKMNTEFQGSQQPFFEFFSLVYLKTGDIKEFGDILFKQDDKELIKRVYNLIGKKKKEVEYELSELGFEDKKIGSLMEVYDKVMTK